MTTPTITRYAEDAIECRCGNAPHLDGFYCSDADGTSRDADFGPTPEWDGRHITCRSCGLVVDGSTAGDPPIVGQARRETLAQAIGD